MNNLPSLRTFNTELQYRNYYEEKYCKNGIKTFDNILVKFYPEKFNDAFFESDNKIKRDKSIFSRIRAERIDWIEAVLINEEVEIYHGWDRDRKTVNVKRRVSIIVPENYVVIITVLKNNTAKFVTAYLADSPRTAKLIRRGQKWQKNDH